jgi:drug/metabolite transporter (DMT)-like permease
MSLSTLRPHTGNTSAGALLVLGSATCFGLSVVAAKAVFATGTTVQGMLVGRFAVAALVLWAVVAARRPAWPDQRTLLTCVGLGAVGYAAQSSLYFGAVASMSAGTAALLLYTYPALVTLAGFLTRRESPTRRTLTALACSALGMVLLLGLGGVDTGSPTGAALALGAALTCSAYTIAASTVPRSADIFVVTAVLTTAALASLAALAGATGSPLGLGASPLAWGWIAAFSLVGTVLALVLHQSGLQRLGPSRTATLSCVEPVVAAVSVALVFGDRLTLGQALGGAAVLGSVVSLQCRRTRRAVAHLPTRRHTERDAPHPYAA